MILKKPKKTATKLTVVFVAVLLMLSLFATSAAAQELYPQISSNNAIVVYNIESGQVLYSNRADETIAPTAATKLVTMMIVSDLFSEFGIDKKTQSVTVTEGALSGIGSLGDKSAPRLGLSAGNSFTAEDLIGASLVGNANDACNALAYYCANELLGGGIGAFVELMNKKAEEIGARNSFFLNAVGLDQSSMVTTVSDVALIAAAFYKYNDLLNSANRPSMRFNNASTIHAKNYLLSDSLIGTYKNNQAIGIIAGQRTDNEDYALITAVEKDGLTYIIAVMEASGEIRNTDGTRSFGEGNAYADMKELIPWTMGSFGYQTLAEENQLVGELRVAMGKSFDHVAVVPQQKLERLVNKSVDLDSIERKIVYDSERVYKGEHNGAIIDMIDAPVSKGQVVGTLFLSYNGEELGSVSLIAQSSVDASGLLSTASRVRSFLFGKTMRVILIIFGAVVAFYVLFSIATAILRGIKRIKKARRAKEIAQRKDQDE